jgi:hypothetical protein
MVTIPSTSPIQGLICLVLVNFILGYTGESISVVLKFPFLVAAGGASMLSIFFFAPYFGAVVLPFVSIILFLLLILLRLIGLVDPE